MSEPYIGEIRLFAGNFAPVGWALCDGRVLSISEYDTLFALIGTTYGGDGQTTFAVPDLRGRVPVHQGAGYALGQQAGSESVALTMPQIPAHGHTMLGTSALANSNSPANAIPAMIGSGTTPGYGSDLPLTTYAPNLFSPAGSSQPHENMQPYLALNFIISLFGIFPSQN